MKKILSNHPEAVILALAVVFLAVVAGFYLWGVGKIVNVTSQALNSTRPATVTGFDLSQASQLDLRGLVK